MNMTCFKQTGWRTWDIRRSRRKGNKPLTRLLESQMIHSVRSCLKNLNALCGCQTCCHGPPPLGPPGWGGEGQPFGQMLFCVHLEGVTG